MSLPEVVSGEEWLAARKQLLAHEKELTRRRDRLNAERRRLPMVRVEKQYVTPAENVAAGTPIYVEGEQPIEMPGSSCFLRDGEEIFHTYSMYARGAEMLGGSYYWLDLTALGRQEDWEEPKGRASAAWPAVPDFSE
ncbi:MAG: hypothetical protein DLM64_10665 [Solirubrobacterales bacterium]|nr:MAG: hypothetical protein DLM64_10665 [Solirubrobacterales bacterium]